MSLIEPEEDSMDSFSIGDRKELIKQGILLDTISNELKTIKVDLIHEHEKRLKSLEDDRIRVTSQIKTIMLLGGFLVTAVQAVVEVTIHIYLNK